jgi:hypothetical protein
VRPSVLLAIAMACVANAAPSQQPALEPGNPVVRTDRLRVGTDSFRIESSFGGQVRRSTLIRTLQRARSEGRDMFVFAQTYLTERGTTVDTSWVDAATLAPVRYFADVYGELQRFTFDEKGGTGTVTPKDSAARPVAVNNATPFFNAVALDLLYASLPLADGFAAKLALYNPPRASFTVELRVTGEEDLRLARGGTIRAWTLDYQLGPNLQKLWLDRRTGEFLRIGSTQGANYFFKYRADLEPPAAGR